MRVPDCYSAPMSACPHCGSDNDSANELCPRCSRPLKHRSSSTLHGLPEADGGARRAPEGAPAGPQPPPGSDPVGSHTLAGVGPNDGTYEQVRSGLSAAGSRDRASGAPMTIPGVPVTLPGGIGRTLTGMPDRSPLERSPLDRTLFGKSPPEGGPSPAPHGPEQGEQAPSTHGVETLPGPGDAAFAAVPAARATLAYPVQRAAPPLDVEAPTPAQKLEPPELDASSDSAADPGLAGAPTLPAPAEHPARDPALLEPIDEPAWAPNATRIGVATPGIAPIHRSDSERRESTPREGTPRDSAIDHARASTPARAEARADGSEGAALRVPRSALVLIAASVLLLVAAAIAALLWRGQPPLQALVSLTPTGEERIDIVCDSCPDGTRIAAGGAETEVRQRKAYLAVSEPLRVGDNRLAFELSYPEGRTSTVQLTLPIEYRVRADTAGFEATPPHLTIVVDALPGSNVTLHEQPLALDPSGHGEHRIELGSRIEGPASEVVTLTETVPYAVVTPAGRRYTGALTASFGVTPLDLEAPGRETITGTAEFLLAGRTAKGGRVLVAGETLAVDEHGAFAQSMSIEAPGESTVTVRAHVEQLAPRLVSFTIRRVDDLEREAARLRREALAFAHALDDPRAHVGKLVHLEGQVRDARVSGARTILLVEPGAGCKDRICVARLVSGGRRTVSAGTRLSAFGRFTGRVEKLGPAQVVADVDVSLLKLE